MRVIKAITPELLLVDYERDACGVQMWSIGRIHKKNRFKCEVCNATLKAGDVAFRPVTNKHNRSARLCAPCAEAISKTLTNL